MKTIINENQRGLLFRNGKFVKLLPAGKHHVLFGAKIEVASLEKPLQSLTCSLDVLLADKQIAAQTVTVDVGDEELALHFVNGKFSSALRAGKYAFWNVFDAHTFTVANTSNPEVSADIPTHVFSKIPSVLYTKVEIEENEKGLLYYDHKLVKLLDAGTHYFWKGATKVEVKLVNTCLTRMDVVGQEILTLDKVSLRINLVCNYRVTDYVKAFTEIDDYAEQLHLTAQLALREYVGKYRIDEILENKEQISSFVFTKMNEKAKEFYVEIVDAGVKDIILPGEIRDIMNTVLVAEKRAQANVITRREEVASTRSLLNTAKLMDENQTLYKLKELEYIEKICEKVGNINLGGNTDILSQLSSVLRGSAK